MQHFTLHASHNRRTFRFDGMRDDEELPRTTHYYLGQSYKMHKACVHIEVDNKHKYAVLQWVAFDSKCSKDDDFTDIKLLIKAALKYVLQECPSIRFFSLDDKADKRITVGGVVKYIAITARLLLQGQQGWYQKHFGAVPSADTERILTALQNRKKLIDQYLHITTRENWGSEKEVIEVAEKVIPQYSKVFLGTSWTIPKRIVRAYDVQFRISQELLIGGRAAKKWNVAKWYQKQAMIHALNNPRH